MATVVMATIVMATVVIVVTRELTFSHFNLSNRRYSLMSLASFSWALSSCGEKDKRQKKREGREKQMKELSKVYRITTCEEYDSQLAQEQWK